MYVYKQFQGLNQNKIYVSLTLLDSLSGEGCPTFKGDFFLIKLGAYIE